MIGNDGSSSQVIDLEIYAVFQYFNVHLHNSIIAIGYAHFRLQLFRKKHG
jgi:hypothetical protein